MTLHDALVAEAQARLHPAPGPRFFVVSERYGLMTTAETQWEAEQRALGIAVGTGRTVYVHDRLTEV